MNDFSFLEALVQNEGDGGKREARGLELFYARLTLGSWDEAEPSALESLIRNASVSNENKRFLLSVAPARLLLYRQLVQKNLRGVLSSTLPRTVARLGDAFEPLASRFFSRQTTRRRMLRELISGFLEFGRAEGEFDSAEGDLAVPPYVWELGQLEAARVLVAAAPETHARDDIDLDLHRGLIFSEATTLLRFSHAVHKLSEDLDDTESPGIIPTQLLCYRSPTHDVKVLDLSPLAALLIEHLMQGASLESAVQGAAKQMNEPLSGELLTETSRLLGDLAQRGIILGVAQDG